MISKGEPIAGIFDIITVNSRMPDFLRGDLWAAIASVRIGALEMAIGNLVGSNLFNLSLLGVDDLLFVQGPLLAAVDGSHAMSAIAAAVMSGALIVALVARPTARLLNAIGWTSVLSALVYFVNAWLHFRHGG